MGTSFSSGRRAMTPEESAAYVAAAPDREAKKPSITEVPGGMARMLASTLRGAVKGVVGGPGDIIEMVNKLRQQPDADTLLPTSQEVGSVLPEVPGGKDSPYEALGENLDPRSLLKKGAAGAAAKAALYAGALRKDLHMAHTSKAKDFLGEGGLPRELTNLSFGIGKGRVPVFENGELDLIPQLGKFDPKRSPSTLTAIDAYSPRYDMAQGSRADDVVARLRQNPIDKVAYLKEQANRRLADRMVSSYSHGGFMGEELPELVDDFEAAVRLPHYGKGGLPKDEFIPMTQTLDDARRQSTIDRFQSFKHYEESPRGAARLASPRAAKGAGDKAGELIEKAEDYASDLPWSPDFKYLDDEVEGVAERLKMAAQGWYENKPKGDPMRVAGSAARARKILAALRNTSSEYGELKAWGHTQLSPESFAGVIHRVGPGDANISSILRGKFEERGIPYHAVDAKGLTNSKHMKIADFLQQEAYKKR